MFHRPIQGTVFGPHWLYKAICLPLLAFGLAVAVSLTGHGIAQAQTTIVVDSTQDPDPASFTQTCTYMEGAFFNPAADGACTLRRALREASARPDTDRPITIEFNLPGGEAVDGVWTIEIQSEMVRLFRKNFSILGGSVILDGDTQPGGRDAADGPKVMINTKDESFEITVPNVEVRNLGFFGGGNLIVQDNGNIVIGNNAIIENIWMGLNADGDAVVFRTPGQPNRMAGGGIILRGSNDNIVRNNVIVGANQPRAINIDSGVGGASNNLIENNWIGMRADGTVPTPFVCSGGTFDETYWFGGDGISLSGSANQVIGNRIAGLDLVRQANDSGPLAIESFGSNHEIRDNIIGIDDAGNKVGVCGYAIKISNTGTDVLDNVIYGSGVSFEDDNATAMGFSGTTSGLTVRRNLVEAGPGRIYDFIGQTGEALREFDAGRITGIDGVTVTGTNGERTFAGELIVSECPNCIVDFYLDNSDDIDEALEYLGETIADSTGNFTFTLDGPLEPGFGLRTMSTAQNPNVIGNLGSSTTSPNSKLYMQMDIITVTLPLTALAGVPISATVDVGPQGATVPLDYLIEATGQNPASVNNTDSYRVVGTFTWPTPGIKTVTVTVSNDLGSITATETIEIEPVEEPEPDARLHIPVVQK